LNHGALSIYLMTPHSCGWGSFAIMVLLVQLLLQFYR
jgi:hypothetical protein